MLEQTLIFHWYVDPLYKEKVAYKMHLACLKEWAHIFTKAIFVLATNDRSDITTLNNIEKDIINCGFGCSIRFEIVDNDVYREARTFKEYIVNRLSNYNGIVFFGHTKGVTNIDNYPDHAENYLHWIFSLYYLSLAYHNYEVPQKLLGAYGGIRRAMFGSLGAVDAETNTNYYAGAFYWLNCKRIKEDAESGEIKIPQMCDRVYAEAFPKIYKNTSKIDARWSKIMNGTEPFLNWETKSFYDETDWNSLADFYLDGENYKKKYEEIREQI